MAAAIVIGLLVLAIAAGVALSALTFVMKTLENTVQWGHSFLGRQHFNARATGTSLSSPFPADDLQALALRTYAPRAATPQTKPAAIFREGFDETFSVEVEPASKTISIEKIGQLLLLSDEPPYEATLSSLLAAPPYPVAAPSEPPTIEVPPKWALWVCEIPAPHFELPYYGKAFSFLNRFVDGVYRDELDKVAKAKVSRDGLMALCAERNANLSHRAAQAEQLYATAKDRQRAAYQSAIKCHEDHKRTYDETVKKQQAKVVQQESTLKSAGDAGLIARINACLRTMPIPDFISREGASRFDSDSGILIHEHRFPDLSEAVWVKPVVLKSGPTAKAATLKEKKDCAASIYPALCLRLACEIARLDPDELVKGIAINGWADYTEKSTGQLKRAYCACLFATKQQVLALKLNALDPIEAFKALKGLYSRSIEVTPISPVMRLDKNDKRFVDGKDVLEGMNAGENLASMDWEDFEHLCRELFERAFASAGAEVKVTRASRDQGVDAVIFDPDPLRGGKIVVQAKRYTNMVDVSAVRDLFGTVHNEGAMKGILVTTSHYGPDSYSFAKDKPLTLIDGAGLLGLLEEHGYRFRIDLAEARARL